MRIAVIGGGLFGSTAALLAARAGHEVHLFEAKSELMGGASRSTFARLHRGYHYPRSPETGRESRLAEASFRGEYGEAVIDGGYQTYIVAEGSRIAADAYRRFLDIEQLPYEAYNGGSAFDVLEPRICLWRLARLVWQKVKDAGIILHLDKRWDLRSSQGLAQNFDHIIVAAYVRINCILGSLGIGEQVRCKFQVVEKPVVRLPDAFKARSIVVIDGPFGCIDPLDDTPYHVLGHVTRTIHAENVGYRVMVPDHLAPLIDMGSVSTPHTHWRGVVDDLARFIPGVERAEYLGSAFTLRAVLAGCEASDRRPTHVDHAGFGVTRIFSGKLGTAVYAARQALDRIQMPIRAAA